MGGGRLSSLLDTLRFPIPAVRSSTVADDCGELWEYRWRLGALCWYR